MPVGAGTIMVSIFSSVKNEFAFTVGHFGRKESIIKGGEKSEFRRIMLLDFTWSHLVWCYSGR